MNADTALKIISMVEACAIWATVFVVVYFITKAVGMTNNLPKEAKKRLEDLNKFVSSFTEKVNDEKPDTEKEMVKAFKKLNKLHKVVTKIFAVYTYDHPFSVESNDALESIHKIHSQCQKISYCISKKQYEEIDRYLKNITAQIEAVDKQLDKVIVLDEEERILHA